MRTHLKIPLATDPRRFTPAPLSLLRKRSIEPSFAPSLHAKTAVLPISQPGDATERAADDLADQAMQAPGPSLSNGMTGATSGRDGCPLDSGIRQWFEPRFGHDFSQVRIHSGPRAAELSRRLNARALSVGHDVAFAPGEYEPRSLQGRRLLAHELSHVILGADRSPTIARKTRGEAVIDRAHMDWLDPDAKVKDDIDIVKSAIKEIKQGKSVQFNDLAARKKIASALDSLGKLKELVAVTAEWEWLTHHHSRSGQNSYKQKEKAFFAHFQTPLATLSAKHPKAQTKYWLKNTPPQVMDAIFTAADAALPADQLWAYAFKEGLADYVRNEIGLSKNDEPAMKQLMAVSTTKAVSGFQYLGTDDFWTDLTAKRMPLSGYLPQGYDLTRIEHESNRNEKYRWVDSARSPDLIMGLQALSAQLRRRRDIFLADATRFGYSTPTTDELVYWTYVYFNSGEYTGQLVKYKGKRKLSDWITKGEYPNAIKLLESYRMVCKMNIF